MQRFPFSVVYLDDPESVTIVAIAHSKRKPGYWKDRLYRDRHDLQSCREAVRKGNLVFSP
jgi:hypothetical protein